MQTAIWTIRQRTKILNLKSTFIDLGALVFWVPQGYRDSVSLVILTRHQKAHIVRTHLYRRRLRVLGPVFIPCRKILETPQRRSTTLPFGKIPILEVDGLNLHQSLAIARYLAKNTDLAGKTELEQCQVDAIVDTLDDFMSRFPWAEKKQDIKNQMFNELLTYDGPHLLQDLDTYLGEKEWLTGNSVTWADFYWEICSTTLLVFKPDLLDIHPRLVTLRKKVQAIPAIADWIQRRPQTKL
ncbi:hematopoietic prostaglandin D synthase [Leptonychotes weddellii]|uniref:glutathione transferase n=1 Tax=Leptonychotes weddellii TaxID=9713 RepID=A0A7F8QV77_LEPWE|nr:hematopoietic prostaglandin D synthase [Leptonychotes weddellii]